MFRSAQQGWLVAALLVLLALVALAFVQRQPGPPVLSVPKTVAPSQPMAAVTPAVAPGITVTGVKLYAAPEPLVKPLWASLEECCWATPEDAHLAQVSATNRDWLLACFDAYTQEYLLTCDREGQGKMMNDLADKSNYPLPPKYLPHYLLRINAAISGHEYGFLKIRLGVNTPEATHSMVYVFRKEGSRFVRTFTMNDHPFTRRVLGTPAADLARELSIHTANEPHPTEALAIQ